MNSVGKKSEVRARASDGSFYVYQHRRLDDGSVFYIGKGAGGRAWLKCRRNAYWRNIASKHGFSVEIVCEGMDEQLAFLLECELIEATRRKSPGVRTLANMTKGGEGASGFRPTEETLAKLRERPRRQLTDDQKAHLSELMRGRPKSDETRAKLSLAAKGRKVLPEHIAKSAASRRGMKHSAETRAKIAAYHLGREKSKEQIEKGANAKRNKPLRSNTSGFANVYLDSAKGVWVALVPSPRKKVPGYFKTPEEAFLAQQSYAAEREKHAEGKISG